MLNLKTIFLFIYLIGFSPEFQAGQIKVISYDIDVFYLKQSSNINVSLVCNIKIRSNLKYANFILSRNCKIKSIKIKNGEKWINVNYSHEGKDSVDIKFSEKLKKYGVYSLKFEYDYDAGEYNGMVFMIGRGDRWYPLIMDQIASFKIICRLSRGMKALSAGNLIKEKIEDDTALYCWQSIKPVFKIPLIIFNPSKYTFTKFVSGTSKIELYSVKEDTSSVSNLMIIAADVLKYYDNILGNYTYNKLSFFEIGEFPGIDIGSGLIMIGTQSLKAVKQGFYDGLILSIAEQWFGASLFAEYGQPGFSFLNISLPQFLKLMYIRHADGEKLFLKSLMEPIKKFDEFANTERDIPVIEIQFPDTREKGLILYGKAPFILYKLENDIGRNQWLKFLKMIYIKYRGKILTYKQFRVELFSLEKRAPVLNTFDKMMGKKGMP